MTDTKTTYGEIAYDAYCRSVGGKAYNGEPLPAFADIAKDSVRRGWEHAARGVLAHIEHAERLRENHR